MKKTLLISLLFGVAASAFAQVQDQDPLDRDRSKYATYSFSKDDQYTVETPYETVSVKQPKGKKVKNVIFMIGDGTGLTQWSVGWVANGGAKVWKKQLGSLAPGIKEVGDLCYDPETDLLWVSDSEAFKIFVFDGEVTTLKAIYDVSFIGNAESICVDHARNCVWMADDGTTSKIYKISFSGL